MKTSGSSIFIGDYVRAVRALHPAGGESPATCAAIARLLGFDLAREEAPAAIPGSPPPDLPPARTRPSRQPWRPSPAPQPASKPKEEPRWIPSAIETITAPSSGGDGEDVLAGASALESGPSGDWEGPPVEPLLVARWTRGILHTLASTAAEGDLDLDRLIELLGQAAPVTRLPRLPWPTLRCGIRVLVDVGPGMMPFAADTRWLLERLGEVVGVERIRVQVFSGGPLRGPLQDGFGKVEGFWRPPPLGTPVLLVSDLGAARERFPLESAGLPEWLEFARQTRRAGCPLMALSPWASSRHDRKLRRALNLIPWDRRTTAGRLRRQMGRHRRSNFSADVRI